MQLQKSVEQFPNFVLNHVRLAHLNPYLNKFDDAIAEESKAWMLSGMDPAEAFNRADALRLALGSKGPQGYWEKVLEFSQTDVIAPEGYSSSYGMAILFTRLGQKDRAIESLELAFSQRQLAMTEIAIEPAFDSLRSDARFASLMRRVTSLRPRNECRQRINSSSMPACNVRAFLAHHWPLVRKVPILGR